MGRGKKRVLASAERAEGIKARILQRTEALLSELEKRDTDQSALAFFETIHLFFADYCKIHYEFTYDELLKEVKRKKTFDEFLQKKITAFVDKLKEKEFSGTEFSKIELRQLAAEFKLIVKTSTARGALVKVTAKPGIVHRMRFALHGAKKRFGKKDVQEILLMLSAAEESAEDIENAQAIYSQAQTLYERLSNEEQKDVHKSLVKAYERIQEVHADHIMQEFEELQDAFYTLIESGENSKAKETYDRIQKVYEGLPTKNRKRVYAEMKRMHQKVQNQIFKSNMTDIRRLLTRVRANVNKEKISSAEDMYTRAQILYLQLPESWQQRLYPQLQKSYKLIRQA